MRVAMSVLVSGRVSSGASQVQGSAARAPTLKAVIGTGSRVMKSSMCEMYPQAGFSLHSPVSLQVKLQVPRW